MEPGYFLLKACPKCRGDMVVDVDQYGAYKSCLQCGLITELPKAPRKQTGAAA